MLITGIGLDGPQGVGLSLARVARTARPAVKVLFIARGAYAPLARGVGEFMRAPADVADVVRAVEEMLSPEAG